MHTEPSFDRASGDDALEALPAAAQRLLEMEIGRPQGRMKVIKEIVLPSEEELQRLAETKGQIARMIAGMKNPLMQKLAASQLSTITDVLAGPFILDIFTDHQTRRAEREEDMGRREWRDLILPSKDPEALAYYKQNALRGSASLNAALNALPFLNSAAQPATPEGRAVLARLSRLAEEIMEMLAGEAAPAAGPGASDDEKLAQIRSIVDKAGGYDSLPDRKKIAIVRQIRLFLCKAIKELAPFYAPDAAPH